jgi:hypothetical protein
MPRGSYERQSFPLQNPKGTPTQTLPLEGEGLGGGKRG